MEKESAYADPEGPLGPLATEWIQQLTVWYEALQSFFGSAPTDHVAAWLRQILSEMILTAVP